MVPGRWWNHWTFCEHLWKGCAAYTLPMKSRLPEVKQRVEVTHMFCTPDFHPGLSGTKSHLLRPQRTLQFITKMTKMPLSTSPTSRTDPHAQQRLASTKQTLCYICLFFFNVCFCFALVYFILLFFIFTSCFSLFLSWGRESGGREHEAERVGKWGGSGMIWERGNNMIKHIVWKQF